MYVKMKARYISWFVMNPEEDCSQCTLPLRGDHSCTKSLAKLVLDGNLIVKENDGMIESQNIVLAKSIRDVQELKDQVNQMEVEFQKKIDLLSKQVEELRETKENVDCEPSKVSKQHKELIDKLKSEGHIKSGKVYQVMCSVDFQDFGDDYTNQNWQVNKAKFFERYVDRVADASRVLYMFSNAYVATCMALIVGKSGLVVTEGDTSSQSNVRKSHGYLLDEGRLVMVDGKWSDLFSKGYNKLAPYDVIITYKRYFTKQVESQLKPGGTCYDPWDDAKLN